MLFHRVFRGNERERPERLETSSVRGVYYYLSRCPLIGFVHEIQQ
jgi:hypothetical protein